MYILVHWNAIFIINVPNEECSNKMAPNQNDGAKLIALFSPSRPSTIFNQYAPIKYQL